LLLSPTTSTLDRRRFVALGAALLLSGGARQAAAEASPDRLIDILYNLAWVPDGTPAEKHAYVVFAPWCPYCKELFIKSRPLVSRIQLRWIPAGSRNAQWRRYNASLGLSRDVRQLAALWASGGNMDAEPRRFTSVDLNEGVIAAYRPQISEIAGVPTGFPTTVYRTAKGVRVFNGAPANLEARLNAIATDANYPVDGSKSITLLRRPITETPLLNGQHVRARRSVDLRALPFTDAPVVGALRSGESQLALAEVVTESGRWIALELTKYDVRAYLPRADVDVRLL